MGALIAYLIKTEIGFPLVKNPTALGIMVVSMNEAFSIGNGTIPILIVQTRGIFLQRPRRTGSIGPHRERLAHRQESLNGPRDPEGLSFKNLILLEVTKIIHPGTTRWLLPDQPWQHILTGPLLYSNIQQQ
jgi:hypothetical protein